MKDMNEVPLISDAEVLWMAQDEHRKQILHKIASQIVSSYVDIDFNHAPNGDETQNRNEPCDKVQLYAKRLLSLGCFYLEFCDAIKEGDGDRVIRCWRYMLPIFVSSGRTKYSIEALNLLLQHDFLLSPRQAFELAWGRFINVHGAPGKNISNDLHLEHLNRLVKYSIQGLGANKTKDAIVRCGKALGTISPVLDRFDMVNGITHFSGRHESANVDKDMKLLCSELVNVFHKVPDRVHNSFSNPKDPLHAKSHEQLKVWILEHIKL